MSPTASTPLPRTVVRFAVVGLVNTAIDLALFWLLVPSLGVVVANLLSTSAGMAFSFWCNGRHTFGASRVTSRQAMAFLATNAFSQWLLQPLVITALHETGGLALPAAKVVALGSSVGANFLLYRYVVWPAAGGSGGSRRCRLAPIGSKTTPGRAVIHQSVGVDSVGEGTEAVSSVPLPEGRAAARAGARR